MICDMFQGAEGGARFSTRKSLSTILYQIVAQDVLQDGTTNASQFDDAEDRAPSASPLKQVTRNHGPSGLCLKL